MNTNRIKALLRYDWVTNRRKFGLVIFIILALYVCLAILSYGTGRNFESIDPKLPTKIAAFIYSYFNYSQLAMIFFLTTILHHKFTNPRSATSYLSMPGTSLEKWAVMLIEYLLGALLIVGLYFLSHALTMLIGYIISPEVNWLINPLKFYTKDGVNDVMMAFSGFTFNDTMINNQDILGKAFTNLFTKNFIFLSQISNASLLLAYLCMNMCFRTNGQLKTIGILVLGYILLIMVFTVFVTTYIAVSMNGENPDPMIFLNLMQNIFTFIAWLIYASPLFCVGFGYLFYRQIAKKQAK